jgi:NAD(P)-dependent dehydrogenase (short-subunit alcohol dehydrogenase family)
MKMKYFKNKIIIVTGGASGIGLALSTRFIREGAKVIICDLNKNTVEQKAKEIGATAFVANVGIEADIKNLVEMVLSQFGQIDMFVSNAGIAFLAGIESPAEKWKTIYDINLLAHVYAAKYVLPGMIARGEGYLLNTASAAGLLIELDAAPYTATKHAAVGLAEWLAIHYKNKGITLSVLCPAAVRTPMITGIANLEKNAIGLEELVDKVMEAVANNRFLISTDDQVDKLFQLKGNDYDEYIRVMDGYRAESEKLNRERLSPIAK